MPLVRFEVRNEYGLGAQELYKVENDGDDEDPKTVLEGVTVAGLVGILRQLGDLAEFAAEVFHDLQEQVMATASRSHKMVARVQHMEAELPALEKVVLAQKSHIHFAYTDGLEWHPKIQTEKNHLIYSDLPRFIMDSYEECRDPPSFHLLDKFDNGGPGSCLRRYSDPSYFKRALAGSELLTSDKVQREKKVHRSKRRGSRQRNGEVPPARQWGRMQFASPNYHGQSSAAESISTFNMRSKSELGDRTSYIDSRRLETRSTSFDSRPKLDNTGSSFDVSSSTRSVDQEQDESSTPRLNMQHNSSDLHPNVQDRGQYGFQHTSSDLLHPNVQKRSQYGSSPVQSIPKSSSVTWDEKTEIVKPPHKLDQIFKDQEVVSELLPSSSDMDKASSPRHVNPVDLLSDSDNVSESIFDGNQFDEVGSEPDSYVDALNTMDSEIETDVECQTKREVELSSAKLKNKEVVYETAMLSKMASQNLESPDVESLTATYSSTNRQLCDNNSNLMSSEDIIDKSSPRMNDMNSDPGVSVDAGLCSVSRTNHFETVINDQSPLCSNIPNAQSPVGDSIINHLSESEESHAKVPVAPSIQFWTNGGLLGLQPSKPPDLSGAKIVKPDSSSDIKVGGNHLSSETVVPNSCSNGSASKLDILDEMIENKKNSDHRGNLRSRDTPCPNEIFPVQRVRTIGSILQDLTARSVLSHDKTDNNISKENHGEILSAISEVKIGKSGGSPHNSSCINVQGPGTLTTTGADMTVSPDVKSPSSSEAEATGKQNGESTSSIRGLSHGLHVNGFGKKLSLHDDTSESPATVKTGLMKLHAHYIKQEGQSRVLGKTYSEQKPKKPVDHWSPLNSPPLEHMKISFHPINAFEPSSLKLKFPDGLHFQESIKDDKFPSFQLLPELSTSLQDIGYDSEDDTFCRSSPYMSDERLSQCSDSSSEQWESGQTPGSNKDPEMYASLQRASSSESISSPFELEGIAYDGAYRDSDGVPDAENGFIPFHNGPLLDFPSFDVVNHSTNKQEQKIESDPNHRVDLVLPYKEPASLLLPIEPTPPPPPLPPLEWRMTRPNFVVVEDEQDAPSKFYSLSDDLPCVGILPAQQHNQEAPPRHQHCNDATSAPLKAMEVSLEWRMIPNFSVGEDEQDAPSKADSLSDDLPSVGILPAQQHNQESASRHQHCNEATSSPMQSKEQLKMNRYKEPNQVLNSNNHDDRGDLLQQIRSKSFNLRRTTPVKQTPPPGPTNNNQVSAILEKANAIRQAFVGSDDGDDENWSDS